MTMPAAIRSSYHRPSAASEKSLLRSFSVIHRPSTDSTTGISNGHSDGNRDSWFKPDRGSRRCSKAARSETIDQDDRRGCPSQARAPGPTAEPVVSMVYHYQTGTRARHKDRNENAIAHPVPSVGIPAPPFAKSSVEKKSQHKGFRQDYRLGDFLRTPSHMRIEPTDGQACRAASSLEEYDFAFVKRSDGSFSYAIVAYRSMEPVQRGNKKSKEECMTFVMCDADSTKKVCRRNWGKYVRLVSLAGVTDHPPISMISFDPRMDDEYSMISNVSEQARPSRRRQVHYRNDAV